MEPIRTLSKRRVFIPGGAGFVGSNLVEEFLREGCHVTVYDNLSLGKLEFIERFLENPLFKFVKDDLLNIDCLKKSMAGHDVVFHMAANSDISYGARFTDVDLKQGTVATYNVLEAMRINKIREIVFASTSAVYGETNSIQVPEDHGPLLPISFYGASKLACEGLISAFCDNYDFRAWVFRFANIIGRNGTHGVIYDFIKKLRKNSEKLEILGDGNQCKPYLHIKECIDGMLHGYAHSAGDLNVYNLACEGGTTVKTIARTVVGEMSLNGVEFEFAGGNRGWAGDVPYVRLDPSRIASLGWRAKYSSDEAVTIAVRELLKQI